jgi:type IV pilus biogenesis protein CpaD/CtpE
MILLKTLFILAVFGVAIAGSLTGCASTEKDPNAVATEPISTIPWNRPQNWEGKGVLGGMTGQ